VYCQALASWIAAHGRYPAGEAGALSRSSLAPNLARRGVDMCTKHVRGAGVPQPRRTHMRRRAARTDRARRYHAHMHMHVHMHMHTHTHTHTHMHMHHVACVCVPQALRNLIEAWLREQRPPPPPAAPPAVAAPAAAPRRAARSPARRRR